jgi:hypothetical protein
MRNSHRELANSPSPRSGGQLAELSNPLHLNYPIHRPIGVQFLIRARLSAAADAENAANGPKPLRTAFQNTSICRIVQRNWRKAEDSCRSDATASEQVSNR